MKTFCAESNLVRVCVACTFIAAFNLWAVDLRVLGATHQVRSADDISDLIESRSLAPGDTVVWADGEYTDEEISLNGISGLPKQPITLQAATPGGVKLLGESQIRTNGKWLVIEGFHFVGGKGKVNAYNPIQFRGSGDVGAEHVRLTNCAFTNLNNNENTAKWVQIYGRFNRVDHCHFSGKPNKGALLTVELSGLASDQTAEHTIEWNYFADVAANDGSDNETVRLGYSGDQAKPATCTVQYNLFERCDGEHEIVSNKSSHNTYRANTFRRCNGSLVLRHGHHATVSGNYFLGDGAADAGGIRINDSHHKIFNNYMQDLTGLTWNAAISIEGGNKKSNGNSSGYQTVDEVIIVHNTIVNCAKGILLYDKHGKRAPRGIVANNLVVAINDDQKLIDARLSADKLMWQSNLFFGFNGSPEQAGIKDQLCVDPKLTKANGRYRVAANSPAIDAASDGFDDVKNDIRLQPRPESAKDIGADEFTDGSTNVEPSLPLTVAAVGVSFLKKP